MKRIAFLGAFLLAGCASLQAPEPPAGRLDEVVEDYFEEWLAQNPTAATDIGDHRWDDRLEIAPSAQYAEAAAELERHYLALALAIPAQSLSDADRLTQELFVYGRQRAIERSRFPRRLLPLSPFDGGIATDLPIMGGGGGSQPFATPADYARWLTRASRFPDWVDAAIVAMREGMAMGIVHPRVVMAKVVPQLESLVSDDPEESVFWGPVASLPAGWPAADRERIAQAFRRLIADALNPGYRRLAGFIRDEYLPACRDTVGWSALPDGANWYAAEVRRHTTTGLTPAEIHALGLAEVARIRGEMEDVLRQVGFTGGLQDFFRYVQREPAFHFSRPAELIEAFERVKRQVRAELPRLFLLKPGADYEIREVEAFRAASAAGGSYRSPSADGTRPGVFYVNTYNLAAQPVYGVETLSLHEAEPGHHFQGTIQQELKELPRFRRFFGIVAYDEGWALYSESLGRELGLFTDPMQWYGRLSDEMLRAMRLVVDTGLHAQGWSREQAIRYLRDNSSLADSDIVAEVERYIVYPGQALGYKIGDLRIQALRHRAEAELGARFDIREFHSRVLEDGALPLDLLEAKLDRWIESERAAGGQ